MTTLKRRENNLQFRNDNDTDCIVVTNISEAECIYVLSTELRNYRSLDIIKKKILKDHSHNFHDISRMLTISESGFLSFEA